MAKQTWKLGDLEFDSEKEYQDATKDLKKIKKIMEQHDITVPAEARIVLKELEGQPVFVSDYGLKFVEKLEKTVTGERTPDKAPASKPDDRPAKTVKKEKKVHIITKRNIAIGMVLILLLVAARFAAPQLFPQAFGGASGEESENIERNLVLAYAKNQVGLQTSFYNYYKNVLGEEAQAALDQANSRLSDAYCINLADEDVADYTDAQIHDIYVKLHTAGELVNGSFNEPQAITDLKATIAKAGVSGVSGSDEVQTPSEDTVTDAESRVRLVNKMMDYQQRVAAQLTDDYGMFDFSESEIKEYVTEDMEKMFGHIIYDMKMSDSDKEAYYNSFADAGLIANGSLVRFTTNPIEHNLPDLTPTIRLADKDGKTEEIGCSQRTLTPVAGVVYELHDGAKTGALLLRGNGTGIGFVQDDDGNSVTTQGDFFLNWGGKTTSGEWYYNSSQLGFLINDERAGGVQYVYELMYN